jgi:hypothetical protein
MQRILYGQIPGTQTGKKHVETGLLKHVETGLRPVSTTIYNQMNIIFLF